MSFGEVDLPLMPRKSLFDFQRLSDIRPGATVEVTFTLTEETILLATADGDLVKAPGDYLLTFEDGSGEHLKTELRIPGRQRIVEPFPMQNEIMI